MSVKATRRYFLRNIQNPCAGFHATLPILRFLRVIRGKSTHSVSSGSKRGLYGRPLPAIFDVPPKFLEPVVAICPGKNIHASVVLGIFDADENGPRLVDTL
jgi:hypothetical protein